MCQLEKKQNNKISLILVIIFLCAITLRYPLLLMYPFPGSSRVSDFFTIDLSVISALSLFMILVCNDFSVFLKSNKLFLLSLLIFFLISILQFFIFPNYSYREYAFSISWIIIPLSVYLYSDTFKKCILPYFGFLWIFNAVYAVPQLYYMTESIGIPANRNWHGGFIISCTPLFLFGLYQLLKKYRIPQNIIYTILAFPLIFSAVTLFRCYSRGANLALAVTILLFIIILLKSLRPQNYKKILLICSAGFILVGLLTILLYGDHVASYISRDIRIPLWRGAVDMFINNLPIGVGSPSYESQYVFNIPIDRFIRSWYFTDRSDHPHNHILYLAGSFGFFGITSLLFLSIYPLIQCFKKYKGLTSLSKLIFFAFLTLSIHSLFDMVIFRWPTVFMALILQGILWKEVFIEGKVPAHASDLKTISGSLLFRILSRGFIYAVSLSILYLACAMTYDNIYGSLYCRDALIKNDNNNKPYSLYLFDKSVKSSQNPLSIYRAGILSLIEYNDHRLGLEYFKKLDKHPAKIIAHANSHMANCYIKLNRKT